MFSPYNRRGKAVGFTKTKLRNACNTGVKNQQDLGGIIISNILFWSNIRISTIKIDILPQKHLILQEPATTNSFNHGLVILGWQSNQDSLYFLVLCWLNGQFTSLEAGDFTCWLSPKGRKVMVFPLYPHEISMNVGKTMP